MSDVLDLNVKPLAFIERFNIHAGDGLCSDKTFINHPIQVFALLGVRYRQLLDVAPGDAEFLVYIRDIVRESLAILEVSQDL